MVCNSHFLFRSAVGQLWKDFCRSLHPFSFFLFIPVWVAKAITKETANETSKKKIEKKTGNNKNLKHKEDLLATDADDHSWEKEAELIKASLMMLQNISDSDEEDYV